MDKQKALDVLVGLTASPKQFSEFYKNRQTQQKETSRREFDMGKMQAQEGLRHQYRTAEMDYKNLYAGDEGGYETEAEIPQSMGGLPLKGVTVNKRGRFEPKYGTLSMEEQMARKMAGTGAQPGAAADSGKSGGITSFFGNMFKSSPPPAAAQTVVNRSTGERLKLDAKANRWVPA